MFLNVSIMESDMTKKLLFRDVPRDEGYSLVLSDENTQLKDLKLGRLRLPHKGSSYAGSTSKSQESLIHVLIGECDIHVKFNGTEKTFKKVGQRNNIFGGLPHAVLAGPETEYRITATSASVDIAIPTIELPSPRTYDAVLIRADDVPVYSIGEGNYKREVRVLLGGEGPSIRLRAGETINPPGAWSSWPRHSFDHQPELATQFEEIFLYYTKPRNGYALQPVVGRYVTGNDINEVWMVRNGDMAVVPLGDHPVVAAPDTTLLYVWYYVSPISKIYPKWSEDLGEYA